MFGPIAEPIETERLTLDPLAVAHAEEMAEVLSDPGLYVFMGGEPLTPAELRARYRRLVMGPAPYHQEGWLNWTVRRRADGQAVGTVQATVTPGVNGAQACVAWIIGVPYQGRGFATEAAEAMIRWLRDHSVTEILASIHPQNLASANAARRIGLRPTGKHAGDEIIWRG